MLRLTTLVAAAVVAVAGTIVTPIHRLPAALHQRPVANVATFSVMPWSGSVPNVEPNGRVVRWQNDRLLAAEAAARAAAQQASLQANARAARSTSLPAGPPAAIPSYPPGTVQDIITKAFTPYGSAAVAWGLRVAKCESGYNPRAYNPAGPYYGLFQFLMSTFKATPYGGQDIYDPVANASAAAWKYGQGGAGAWGCG